MKNLDNFSKRIIAVAILLFSLSAFVFSISKATASGKTNTPDIDRLVPISISNGKAYYIIQGRGLVYQPLTNANED